MDNKRHDALAAHALPHWVIVVQDNALLTRLILAEAYLLGTLMTLGWVRSIEDIPGWGIFHGIGVLLFFAAGATAAGVALRCSVTAAAFQRHAWGTGLFNFTGLLVFSASEVWASLSERSANLAPTPADNAVLNLLGWHGVPVSPTVVIVALLLPFASLYWGFSQQQHAPAKTGEDIEAERTRKLAEQQAKNELAALKAAGKRRTEMAYDDPDSVLDSPGNDDVNTGGLHAVTTGDSDAESAPNEPVRRRNNPGTKAIPSDMMSAPQFPAYLRENGVTISAEKAVAYVQSVLGYERVGTTFCARKAPLMKLANRLIERAQNTSNAPAMAEERGA
jgi:hypothetical protein